MAIRDLAQGVVKLMSLVKIGQGDSEEAKKVKASIAMSYTKLSNKEKESHKNMLALHIASEIHSALPTSSRRRRRFSN